MSTFTLMSLGYDALWHGQAVAAAYADNLSSRTRDRPSQHDPPHPVRGHRCSFPGCPGLCRTFAYVFGDTLHCPA